MLTGKERVIKTIKGESVDRVAWVPFAGVHAGSLLGYSAKEVLTDEDKLVESLIKTHELYTPDGMPVVFDLQVEAEILGCELVWSDDTPPSVKTHPLEGEPIIPCRCKLPDKDKGRIPMILGAMRRMKEAVGEDTALYGLICGPFTLASHLRGNDIFMDMILDEDYVKRLLDYTAEAVIRMADLYIEAGMDIIAIVDPLVSQISPDHFDSLCHDSFTTVFTHIRQQGAISSFFVCGNATKQLEVMCKTSPDSLSIDENVDIIEGKKVTDQYGIAIGGNIPLTTLMLHGTQQENMKYVVNLLDNISHERLIIAPGCDMPYDVPKENTIGVAQAVRDTDTVREMVKNYESPPLDIEIQLPDYENLSKPLVEAFTLDSATCAACTYMWGAVVKAKEHFGDAIDVVEYKYTKLENIVRCQKMGVQKLPSVYINGELKWSSIIPSRDELFAAIESNLK